MIEDGKRESGVECGPLTQSTCPRPLLFPMGALFAARPASARLLASSPRAARPALSARPSIPGRGRRLLSTPAAAQKEEGMPAAPGRPLSTPPPLAVAAALGGLTWVSLLGFPGSPLPAPLRELGLRVVAESTARTIASAAWAAHAAEAAYAAFACLSAGADAGAAAWWAVWAFFAGFPALLVMAKTLPKKGQA